MFDFKQTDSDSESQVLSVDEMLLKLVDQTTSRVEWQECVQATQKEGVTEFLEIGPKAVLKGLVEKIAPGTKVS